VSLSKGSDYIKELPSASTFLGSRAKHHYKRMGKILIASECLKTVHLPSLEVLSENLEQWEWAIREIRSKNKKVPGSGYIQKYNSGAKNISVELTVKRDAEKAIMQCFKLFGLDPKSEKELKGMVDGNQGDLFDGFAKRKTN
jgi:phage terminase small subunit